MIIPTVKGDVQDEAFGLRLGAEDYISKPISPPILKARIKTHLALGRARRERGYSARPGDPGQLVSAPRRRGGGRAMTIKVLIAEGRPTAEIASNLFISAKTVETHRKHIMDKLGLRSIAELTKYAVRQGITQL